MAIGYVLYNPLAGGGNCAEDAKLVQFVLDDELEYYDMTRVTNYEALLSGLGKEDYIVLVGGDGTLNRSINDTAGLEILADILYFPSGTGNDFAHELGKEALSNPVSIKQYLQNLPSVQVKGKTYHFLNGIGFGIDGYCCQEGDKLRKLPGKKVNYTAIAIKGLLFHFDARNAKVTVDGKQYEYKKVWIAPTMLGKYYGGGMIPTPGQDRMNPDKTLSLMVFYGGGRLRTLCAFPGIFKGTHIKHKDMIAIHTGHEITVEFDRPTPLQIDGETILGVTAFTAKSSVYSASKPKERAYV